MPESESSLPEAHDVEWGLVCALKIEYAPLLDKLDHARSVSGGKFTFRGGKLGGKKLAIVETGAGARNAERGTQALIDAHAPRWVLSVGFSGGLVEGMKPGDIIVASSLESADGSEHLSLDLKMSPDEQAGLHVGKLVNTNHIVRTVTEKKALHSATDGLAVDMESLAVAKVCQERKVRFMAVRVISDDLSADLPPEILSIIGSKGTIRAGAVVGSLWNRPSSLFDMLSLRERANQSAVRLTGFLNTILPVLAETRSST